MHSVVLVDYGAGNIRSASRALARAAALSELSPTIEVTADPDAIRTADRIILPGVGHFADCMEGLTSRDGLLDALREAVLEKATPFFGICVGMQLLATRGLEDGEVTGLDWIPGAVDRIRPDDPALAVPHMGWNEITPRSHPVLADLGDQPHVYFTHSYAMTCDGDEHVAATCTYGGVITAAIARDNIFGTQFHPEKSQALGQKILANFLKWAP